MNAFHPQAGDAMLNATVTPSADWLSRGFAGWAHSCHGPASNVSLTGGLMHSMDQLQNLA